MRLISLFFILFVCPAAVLSLNVLLVVPFPGPSHWHWLQNIVTRLLERGHHVTGLVNFDLKESHANYTAMNINPAMKFTNFQADDIYNMKYKLSATQMVDKYFEMGLMTSEHAFQDKNVQKLLTTKSHNYDIMLMEEYYTDNLLIVAHVLKLPVVTMYSLPPTEYLEQMMGLYSSLAHTPNMVLPYSDEMTFTERAYNLYVSLYEMISRKFYLIPELQRIMQKYCSKLVEGPLPSIEDMQKNISMIMMNAHLGPDPPRATFPGIINIGSIQMKKPTPLPRDIQEFIDEAEHGVIYFSMGAFMKSADMPKETLQVFLKTFAQLKQRIIWKYEADGLQGIPPNVLIKKWMPQNSILAQKNVRAFMTHSGRYGTQEALYWGKPMLCIPLFLDQWINADRLVRKGVALSVDFSKLTTDLLVGKLNTLLDGNFKATSDVIASIYQDHLVDPLDEVSYWVEYVARHKGAPHLKSKAVELNLLQYYLVDIWGSLLIFVLAIIYLIRKCICSLFKSKLKVKKA